MPSATSPFTSAGTEIAFCADAVPPTYDEDGYTDVSIDYVVIGEIADAGEYGRQYNLVTHNSLNNRRTLKRKGSYNDGQMNLQMARVPANLGQAELKLGLASDQPGAFRVTLQDGTKQYFMAMVMSYTTNIGNPDQITGANAQVELTHDIVEVAPA